jgi:choline dehydrogenase-like flavoprotein
MTVLADECREILLKGISQADLVGIESGSVKDQGVRIANHILGGARFGINPQESVLDPNCRAWNFDNLYVTDGSCMPTSGGANPTHTIEANSLRVADHLKTRL